MSSLQQHFKSDPSGESKSLVGMTDDLPSIAPAGAGRADTVKGNGATMGSESKLGGSTDAEATSSSSEGGDDTSEAIDHLFVELLHEDIADSGTNPVEGHELLSFLGADEGDAQIAPVVIGANALGA